MSCDSNRQRLFGAVLGPRVEAALGAGVPAEEVLALVYDVALNQPPPEDKADQLAARAAYQKLKARAAREGIDLYPHQSATGLPAPEAVAAWKQVGALLDALEGGRPLPPLAADAYQSLAFQTLARPEAVRPWNVALRGATLLQMRQRWAADPERVWLLVGSPEALGAAEHAAFLGELTALLADDGQAPPHLAAAARHAKALDDEGMLGPEERAAWARVLASVAGIGVGQRMPPGCSVCGATHDQGQPCDPDDLRDAGEVAAAVAGVLADPDELTRTVDRSPFTAMECLLDDWAMAPDRERRPLPPHVARLLAAAYQRDRRRVLRMAPRYHALDALETDLVSFLRNATLRAPVLFDGAPHVWDAGGLYPLGAYLAAGCERQRAGAPSARVDGRGMILVLGHPAYADPGWFGSQFSFGEQETALRFALTGRPIRHLFDGDIVVEEECGCVFRCRRFSASTIQIELQRIGTLMGSGAARRMALPELCPTHSAVTTYTARHRREVQVIDRLQPRFAAPTWPDPTVAPPKSGPAPSEAPDVVR